MTSPERIPSDQIGHVGAAVHPAERATGLGSVRRIAPTGSVAARSHTTVEIVYTAGLYGIDDGGAVKIAMRFPYDGGALQADDPTAPNWVSAEASNGSRLQIAYSTRNPRPWFKALTLRVLDGCLRQGDTIRILLGDTRQGSPGFVVQTFCEDAFDLRFSVDAIATGHFVVLPAKLAIPVVPGPPAVWRAVLPTRRPPGTPFSLGLKLEDAWGNPVDLAGRRVTLRTDGDLSGLPAHVELAAGRGHRIGGLTASSGVHRIRVEDDDGALLTTSNPVRITGDAAPTYWADLHGQSAETVGVNSAHRYFAFARDLAFLDATSHQGNDFQINARFWQRLNDLTAAFDEPGRFVAVPGYEWSGNTGVGGDRNVYFRQEGRPIRRSSHALLTDRSELAGDCPTATALLEALAEEDAVTFAHVGGRWADLERGHDGRTERSVEIHSAWGTFEWLLHDALRLGHRVGVVCNSDGHKGRPGASYPGASMFGAQGGLTCFAMPTLDRDALFAALRARHHYGTTGARLDLQITAELVGHRYREDPALGETETEPVERVIMGDIVACAGPVVLEVEVHAAHPIERIEVRDGTRTLHTVRPRTVEALGSRLRVVWEGARNRGRGRMASWEGTIDVEGTRITRWEAFNRFNPERPFEADERRLSFSSATTGNHAGVDLWLDRWDGVVGIDVGDGVRRTPIPDIGLEDVVHPVGPMDRRIRLFRLPDSSSTCSMRFRIELPPQSTEAALWVAVTLEDGHQAWSSPIYVLPSAVKPRR